MWQFSSRLKTLKFFFKHFLESFHFVKINHIYQKIALLPRLVQKFLDNFDLVRKKLKILAQFWHNSGPFLGEFWSFYVKFGLKAKFRAFLAKFRARNFVKVHLQSKWNFGHFTKFLTIWQHCNDFLHVEWIWKPLMFIEK